MHLLVLFESAPGEPLMERLRELACKAKVTACLKPEAAADFCEKGQGIAPEYEEPRQLAEGADCILISPMTVRLYEALLPADTDEPLVSLILHALCLGKAVFYLPFFSGDLRQLPAHSPLRIALEERACRLREMGLLLAWEDKLLELCPTPKTLSCAKSGTVFTAEDIEQAVRGGRKFLELRFGDRITPLARDRAKELECTIKESGEESQ